MLHGQWRAALRLASMLSMLSVVGCDGQPMLGDLSLGGFGIGQPYGQYGAMGPFGVTPGDGWGGGDGGGWGGGWGGDGGGDWGGNWGGAWGGEGEGEDH